MNSVVIISLDFTISFKIRDLENNMSNGNGYQRWIAFLATPREWGIVPDVIHGYVTSFGNTRPESPDVLLTV